MSFLKDLFPSPYDPETTKTFTNHFDIPRVDKLDSPITLFWLDVYNILINSPLITKALRPFATLNKDDELYLIPPSGLSMWWWTLFSLLQVPPLLFLISLSIISISMLQALTALHNLLFWSPIQGPSLQVHPASPSSLLTYNPRHRWIYINGIATGAHGLHQNLSVLSTRFNAPVLGIHNRTYGFLGDVIECVFQRSFSFPTIETRIAVPIVARYLRQPRAEVEKVVLVAHSQGGICAAMILDQLFAEVPWDQIRDRLEVYTFGSAAGHFKNPEMEGGGRLVRHMEHYCHEEDMVTSFGALSALRRKGEVYRGKVFVWKGKGGHLLNQHYLKGMFDPEVSFGEKGFLEGKIEPYKEDSKGRQWYVLPGAKVGRGDKRVKDVSNLWKYMVREGEGKIDEGVEVHGVNGWK
ncbi:Hypothetical protein D9617_16g015520 [Elsinoe fawcettii]|nr:Hypothetical protein D9617_16g015520 [Elsinoe fawcettii]